MPVRLQIDQPLNTVTQTVTDQNGTASRLALSTSAVGIKTSEPATEQRTPVPVEIAGDVKLEYNGSPRLTLYSHGFGTQRYSIRATNDRDAAGGRRLVIRNESHDRDEIILDSQGRVSIAGDIILTGADCAEAFPVEDPAGLEPGTVMVIGPDERLRHCSQPYDRRVAGVISGADRKAGIVLGSGPSDDARIPLALNGRVFCRVDADAAPIEIGDLLTTSSSPGHAMKAADPRRAFGAVIGKALRPLPAGRGLVPILVALQ